MKMSESKTKEPGTTIDRTTLNMIQFYRESLRDLAEGREMKTKIPHGTKKRFIESGIIRKFGPKLELTDLGRVILSSTT